MYGIIDCDNCYVSCERVFRPDLKDKPVVVLSNNDGCVVARSNEAKKMGIKAGTPYFQLAEQFPNQKIVVFSSNYELYGELTSRVVSIIRKEAPTYFRYSIDECFVYLDGMEKIDLKAWGEELHKKIKRNVGMPVSIGLAPNKTLAKMASHFAKKYQGYRHCCMIDSDEKRIKALKLYPIDEVWGIGRRYAARLEALGVKTAYDFAEHNQTWVKATFNNIVIERTWRELNGEERNCASRVRLLPLWVSSLTPMLSEKTCLSTGTFRNCDSSLLPARPSLLSRLPMKCFRSSTVRAIIIRKPVLSLWESGRTVPSSRIYST